MKKDVDYVILLTGIVFFFPLFPALSSNLYLFEQILAVLLCGLCIIFLSIKKGRIKTDSLCISFIFVSLLIISILRSLDILILRDLFELAKPVYFTSFFIMAYSIEWDDSKLIKYFSSLMGFCLIASAVGIGEALNSSIDRLVSAIYKDPRPGLAYRACFSFGSPYAFGSVLILPVFFYFTKVIVKLSSFRSLLCFILTFLCLIFTKSRTIFICYIFSLMILFILILSKKWFPRRNRIMRVLLAIFIIIGMCLPIIISLAKVHLYYLYAGINALVSNIMAKNSIETILRASSSLFIRYKQILSAIEYQDKIPLIGAGIGKNIVYLESFYGLYFYRMGLIGIILHLGLVVYTIRWSLRFAEVYQKLHTKNSSLMMYIFWSIAIYFISFFVSYFSSANNDNVRNGFLFYTIIAIITYYKNHNILAYSNSIHKKIMCEISIIIPSFEPGDYIFECLSSIKKQSLKKDMFEVLLVLSGRKEPYYQNIGKYIEKEYAGLHVNLIYNEKANVSEARNIGLDQSKSQYIAFIDDDDIISENYLNRLYKTSSDAVVALSLVKGFSSEGGYCSTKISNVYEKTKTKKLTVINTMPYFAVVYGKLINRKIIGSRRFDSTFAGFSEDALFMFLISDKIKRLAFADLDTVYFHRFRKNSISSNKYNLKYGIRKCMSAVMLYFYYYQKNLFHYNFILFVSRIIVIFKYFLHDKYKMRTRRDNPSS